MHVKLLAQGQLSSKHSKSIGNYFLSAADRLETFRGASCHWERLQKLVRLVRGGGLHFPLGFLGKGRATDKK